MNSRGIYNCDRCSHPTYTKGMRKHYLINYKENTNLISRAKICLLCLDCFSSYASRNREWKPNTVFDPEALIERTPNVERFESEQAQQTEQGLKKTLEDDWQEKLKK